MYPIIFSPAYSFILEAIFVFPKPVMYNKKSLSCIGTPIISKLNMKYKSKFSAFNFFAKCLEPNNPFSSAEKNTKTRLLLLVLFFAKYFITSVTAVEPEALSFAPFAISSPFTAAIFPI